MPVENSTRKVCFPSLATVFTYNPFIEPTNTRFRPRKLLRIYDFAQFAYIKINNLRKTRETASYR
jgi:hypothetical protein